MDGVVRLFDGYLLDLLPLPEFLLVEEDEDESWPYYMILAAASGEKIVKSSATSSDF